MRTFLEALHVLTAVMLVGPLMLAPFVGHRQIKLRSPDGVRIAAKQTNWFGIGSLATALLGAATVTASNKLYQFRDPWIIISMTLYVVALGLVFFYAVPALRKAARMVEQGVLTGPAAALEGEAETATLTASAAQLHTKEQLDAISGRVAGAALLNLLVFATITILMVVKPFQ